jgi:hypothetical protein
MAEPKFKLGDRVRITRWIDDQALNGLTGVVADPGEYARKHKPKWPATYWKTEPAPGQKVKFVYWIEFGGDMSKPGAVCAAVVYEEDLALT